VEIFCERLYVAVHGDWFGPVRWQRVGEAEHELQGDALIAEGQRRGLELGNPDGLFVDAVAAGRPAYPGVAEALVAHEVADAVYRSAAAGGAPVAVEGRRTTLP
jgi:predicted dehydrogenase